MCVQCMGVQSSERFFNKVSVFIGAERFQLIWIWIVRKLVIYYVPFDLLKLDRYLADISVRKYEKTPKEYLSK